MSCPDELQHVGFAAQGCPHSSQFLFKDPREWSLCLCICSGLCDQFLLVFAFARAGAKPLQLTQHVARYKAAILNRFQLCFAWFWVINPDDYAYPPVKLEETGSHSLEMAKIFILSFFCRFVCNCFCHLSFVCRFVLSFFCRFLSFEFSPVIFFVICLTDQNSNDKKTTTKWQTKWQTKLKRQKKMTKHTTKKWQNKYFDFSNLWLAKIFLTVKNQGEGESLICSGVTFWKWWCCIAKISRWYSISWDMGLFENNLPYASHCQPLPATSWSSCPIILWPLSGVDWVDPTFIHPFETTSQFSQLLLFPQPGPTCSAGDLNRRLATVGIGCLNLREAEGI